MNYPPVLHYATVYEHPCPTCGAPPGRHCISKNGKINTKSHEARSNKVSNHTPLPDLSAWWRKQAKAERSGNRWSNSDKRYFDYSKRWLHSAN